MDQRQKDWEKEAIEMTGKLGRFVANYLFKEENRKKVDRRLVLVDSMTIELGMICSHLEEENFERFLKLINERIKKSYYMTRRKISVFDGEAVSPEIQ